MFIEDDEYAALLTLANFGRDLAYLIDNIDPDEPVRTVDHLVREVRRAGYVVDSFKVFPDPMEDFTADGPANEGDPDQPPECADCGGLGENEYLQECSTCEGTGVATG